MFCHDSLFPAHFNSLSFHFDQNVVMIVDGCMDSSSSSIEPNDEFNDVVSLALQYAFIYFGLSFTFQNPKRTKLQHCNAVS